MLLEDRRGEGPEALAELDLEVHPALHLGPARVAEDRARAERAGSELHPPAQEAHDLALRERVGDDARPLVGVRDMPAGDVLAVEVGLDLVRRERRAEEAAAQRIARRVHLARRAEHLVRGQQCGPERAARIASGRLHEQTLEPGLAQHAAVGHAVQRDAAGHHYLLRSREPGQVGDQLEHDFLGHQLDRGGEVHLAPRDQRVELARRPAEQLLEARIGHQRRVEEPEGAGVQPERPVVADVDQLLADQVRVARRAVRGQAHQLVLAGVDLESAVVRERAVEQPERVRILQLAEQLDPRARADAERAGGPLAHAVDREDRRLLERRGIEAARRVRHVVVRDEHARRLAQAGLQLPFEARLRAEQGPAGRHELLAPRGRDRERVLQHPIERQQRAVVENDRVQLLGLDEPLAQAVVDGPLREARVVLLAREALLLRGRDDLAVTDKGGSRVVIVGRDAEYVAHLLVHRVSVD